jgi:hypothetical protein
MPRRRKKSSELPVPVPIEPTTTSPKPSGDGAITPSTPWRSIGDLPLSVWESELTRLTSPALPVVRECWEACRPYTALGLAQFIKESTAGRDETAQRTKNGLGLMVRGNEPYVLTSAGRKLQVFPSWAASFENYVWRLNHDPYTKTDTLDELISLYLLGWLPGQQGTYPSAESAASAALYKRQTVERLNAWGATTGTQPEPPSPPTLPWPAKWITLAGTTTPIPIPADCEYIEDLTPVGPNRPGRAIAVTGMTWHQTGNVSVGANAVMHSNWQDAGTPGHPDGKVGVHFYVDDSRIIQKIPIGENSIHSGDWRNNAHVSMEESINADRNSAKTERNAMALAAGIVGSVLDSTAKDDLYPHGNAATGCPKFYMSSGRWPSVEASTDNLIRIVKGATPGPTPEPEPTYAAAVPVPKDWDGTDWKREDGALFIALRRVFVAAADSVTCHQSADSGSPEVRRALNRGEAFEAFYVVRGSDLRPWLVSRWGSRIQADLCEPGLDEIFDAIDDASLDDPGDAVTRPILIDPTAGLSAQTVAEDSPQLTKDEFIAGGG